MMNRREALIRMGGIITAGGLLTTGRAGATTTTDTLSTGTVTAGTTGQPFTFAHITDVHLTDRDGAEEWFAKCLHHIQSHPKKPAFILNTGDCVMDTLKADLDRANLQWKIWRNVLTADNSLPIHHCLGNHDIWGLALDAGHAAKKDPKYGKLKGLEGLGIERPYSSFDHGDWHFITLDSVQPHNDGHHDGWIAKLDDEQYHWLEQDLKAAGDKPVVVTSHVSILQVCQLRSMQPQDDKSYHLGPYGMMGDARRTIDLFAKHPNVKLCLSGHIHLLDRIELAGVTYICDGAVSGGWWQGSRMDVPPGYSLTSLNPDGSFDHEYVPYGWDDRHVKKQA